MFNLQLIEIDDENESKAMWMLTITTILMFGLDHLVLNVFVTSQKQIVQNCKLYTDYNCISLHFLPTFPIQLELMDMIHIVVPACTKQLFVDVLCVVDVCTAWNGTIFNSNFYILVMNVIAMKEGITMHILGCVQ